MAWHNRWNDYEEGLEYEEDRHDYSNKQLNQLADDFLREDAKKEICRECEGEGKETGSHNPVSQKIEDEEGNEYPMEIEENENLLYLLNLLKNADHKINREEMKDYRTALKAELY